MKMSRLQKLSISTLWNIRRRSNRQRLVIMIVAFIFVCIFLNLIIPHESSYWGRLKALFHVGSDAPTTTQRPHITWPEEGSFELVLPFLPRTPSEIQDVRDVLLRSLLFFWPLEELRFRLLIDHDHYHKLQNLWSDIKARIPSAQLSIYNSTGAQYSQLSTSDKIRWLAFHADKFTTADYIGFVCPTTVFLVPLVSGDLFRENRPVLHSSNGDTSVDNFKWYKTMAWALEFPAMHRGTDGWPYIFRTEHIRAMRRYVTALHTKNTFADFYALYAPKSDLMFALLCDYVWYFRRSGYAWYIQPMMKRWTSDKVLESMEKQGIRVGHLYPKPKIAGDFRYLRHRTDVEGVMRQGYCFYELSFDCRAIVRHNDGSVNWMQYTFRNISWKLDSEISDAYKRRQNDIWRMDISHKWNHTELKNLKLRIPS